MASTPTWPSLPLLNAKPFMVPSHSLTIPDRAALAYDRAKSIGLAYKLTINDIVPPSKRFWDMHLDPIFTVDTAALLLLTIQYNLCTGTIGSYLDHRPELHALVDDLLKYRKHGQFMLTEVGHGLDIHNIETTATRLASGEFILNTPSPSAAKFMPPSIPAGLPCIAVVFARLLVDGEFRGIRPFIVSLNDGFEMAKGVTARQLPDSGGPDPLNHAITSFCDVRLPASAMLGALEKPASVHDHMLHITTRICVGTMACHYISIPFMRCYVTIGALYSLRRKTGAAEKAQPILRFRTQQLPIVTAVAQVHVLSEYTKWATDVFMGTPDARVRRGMATVSKAIGVQHSQAASLAISDRCGAQGLFAHNRMTALHSMMRGASIAEGDVLTLSIKLAMELVLGRYSLPTPRDPKSPLALHEAGLFEEAREILREAGHHRSQDVNRLMLPRCLPLVEAIGHRMAYDAAVSAGVSASLIDMYVASAMKLDPAWYAENTAFGRSAQQELEIKACDGVLPELRALVDAMGFAPYIHAPLLSDSKWAAFTAGLPVYEHAEGIDIGSADKAEQPASLFYEPWDFLNLVLVYSLKGHHLRTIITIIITMITTMIITHTGEVEDYASNNHRASSSRIICEDDNIQGMMCPHTKQGADPHWSMAQDQHCMAHTTSVSRASVPEIHGNDVARENDYLGTSSPLREAGCFGKDLCKSCAVTRLVFLELVCDSSPANEAPRLTGERCPSNEASVA